MVCSWTCRPTPGSWPWLEWALSLVLPGVRAPLLWAPLSSSVLGSPNVPVRTWVTLCDGAGAFGVGAEGSAPSLGAGSGEPGVCMRPTSPWVVPGPWLRGVERCFTGPALGRDSRTRVCRPTVCEKCLWGLGSCPDGGGRACGGRAPRGARGTSAAVKRVWLSPLPGLGRGPGASRTTLVSIEPEWLWGGQGRWGGAVRWAGLPGHLTLGHAGHWVTGSLHVGERSTAACPTPLLLALILWEAGLEDLGPSLCSPAPGPPCGAHSWINQKLLVCRCDFHRNFAV